MLGIVWYEIVQRGASVRALKSEVPDGTRLACSQSKDSELLRKHVSVWFGPFTLTVSS